MIMNRGLNQYEEDKNNMDIKAYYSYPKYTYYTSQPMG